MRFDGKTAIITGAASGMGLLSAQQIAAEGGNTVLTDINPDALDTAVEGIRAQGGNATGVQVDVRNFGDVERAAESAQQTYGSIDILMNFAGGAESRVLEHHEPFHEYPAEVIDWGLDVNLKGTVYFCRVALAAMIKQKSGVIINLGSITGVEGSARAVCYSAAKSGLIGLTKALAQCGAPHGVRACCVSPGPVLTRPGMANMPTLLGRAAEPQEVVDLVLYLCSDKGAFITGTNYLIDGGRACGTM